MLSFLLVFLCLSFAQSLPVQENCDKSLHAFHDCLKNRFLELPRSNDESSVTLLKWRSVLVQCGAEQSECNLQKKLMKMIGKMVKMAEKFEKDDLNLKVSAFKMKGPPRCYIENEKINGETCRKYGYDQHGLELLAHSEEVACCSAYYLKKVCTIEEFEFLTLFPIMYEMEFYSRHLQNFHSFVEMRHATNASVQTPSVEVFTEECKKSENTFCDCLRNYHEELAIRNESRYSIQKEVFNKCGAAESDCYLQKQLLTWLDSVIGETYRKGFIDWQDYQKCNKKINELYGPECRRERFDRYGFEKPSTSYEYLDSMCRAEYARQVPVCSPNLATFLIEEAQHEKIEAYKYTLDRFVDYVTKGYRYMKVDERVARKMETLVSF